MRVWKRPRGQYVKPHDIYVLADPRSGEIRYVGRTIRGVRRRVHLHLEESKRKHYPVHRWLRRLTSRGLRPITHVVAKGVDHEYETGLCEALVVCGARLLNTRPSYPRIEGRLIVDVERRLMAGDEIYAELVHLGLSVRKKAWPLPDGPSFGDLFEIRQQVAALAFRKLADILDPPKGRRRENSDAFELARSIAFGLIDLVVEGKRSPCPSGLYAAPQYREVARTAIRDVRAFARKNRVALSIPLDRGDR